MRFAAVLVAGLALLATTSVAQMIMPAEMPANSTAMPVNGTAMPVNGTEQPTSGTSIADLLTSRQNQEFLLKAAAAAGLTDTLADPELVITLFAPTDKAFKSLLETLGLKRAELLDNAELLGAVLQYHVVPGVAVMAADLTHDQVLPTMLEGEVITVKINDDMALRLQTASGQRVRIETADMLAGMSIVHEVDEVLLPSGFAATAPAPAPAATTTPCSHIVEVGEALFDIAEKYGMTLDSLLAINTDIADPNMVMPGDEIELMC